MKKAVCVFIVIIAIVGVFLFDDDKSVNQEAVSPTFKTTQITGAVVIPGYYQTQASTTIRDLIQMAGGLMINADISKVDLAQRVTTNLVHIDSYKISVENPDEEDETINYIKVNLNTATIKQLETIPGMTQARIEAFLVYKNQVKTLLSVDELINVKGIGVATLEKIRPFVTV